MRVLFLPCLSLCGTWSAAGCSDGQLGNAAATTPCAPDDPACATRPIPPLAVGARMTLDVATVVAAAGEEPATHLFVVDELVAVEDAGFVRAIGPGATAVLFLTSDGRVLDFTHVATAQPAHLVVARGMDADLDTRGIDGPLTLAPGASATLTLLARSDSQVLGGTFDTRVLVSDPALSVRDEAGSAFTLVAPEDLAATTDITVTFEALDLVTTLTVRLTPDVSEEEP